MSLCENESRPTSVTMPKNTAPGENRQRKGEWGEGGGEEEELETKRQTLRNE